MISWGDNGSVFKAFILVLFLCLAQGQSLAQFFSPRVRVSSSSVDGQSARHFPKIEQRLTDLVLAFSPKVSCLAPTHPIECEILLLVSSVEGDRYTGDLKIRVLRPVYEQQERSLVMQMGERGLTFDFSPYDLSLRQSTEVPEDAFLRRVYYYLLVGAWLYYDSFGDEGGSSFVEYLSAHAANFYQLDVSQPTTERGITPEVLLPRFRDKETGLFREAYYVYHRQGLDQKHKSVERFFDALSSTLDLFEEIKGADPAHPLMALFADTKLAEIGPILGSASDPQSRSLSIRLSQIFPSYQVSNK